ncbi:MAG: hypothetical protein ACE365_00160 [Gammaproteobacteria bacterium]
MFRQCFTLFFKSVKNYSSKPEVHQAVKDFSIGFAAGFFGHKTGENFHKNSETPKESKPPNSI